MDTLTLDRATLDALASDVRVDLLKALDGREASLSVLAREVKLNKSTVFRHLSHLESVGLVKKVGGRLKGAYALTWKGRRLLHPEGLTVALLLAGAAGALLAAVGAALLYLSIRFSPGRGPVPEDGFELRRGGEEPLTAATATDPFFLYAALALLAVSLLLAAVAQALRVRRARSARCSAPERFAR